MSSHGQFVKEIAEDFEGRMKAPDTVPSPEELAAISRMKPRCWRCAAPGIVQRYDGRWYCKNCDIVRIQHPSDPQYQQRKQKCCEACNGIHSGRLRPGMAKALQEACERLVSMREMSLARVGVRHGITDDLLNVAWADAMAHARAAISKTEGA